MNDFDYDVLQKKRIASGAKHIKRGSKSKKCTLPSDFLTTKQRKELNGNVTTYNLNEPMTWKSFKAMPLDIQQEYLDGVQRRFDVRQAPLADMFGVRATSMCHYFKLKGLKWGAARCELSKKDALDAWEKFVYGTEASAIPEAVPTLPATATLVEVPVAEPIKVRSHAEVTKGTLSFTGNMADICSELVSWLGVNKDYTVTIEFEVA